MYNAAHEQRLIDGICGDDALLRKAFQEYCDLRREVADSEALWIGQSGGRVPGPSCGFIAHDAQMEGSR